MKLLKQMYEGLGINKSQRFFRFLLLIIVLIVGFNLAFNVGYTKDKGVYWKPFDAKVDIKK